MTKKQHEEIERTRAVFSEDSPEVFGAMSWHGQLETLGTLHRYESTLHRIAENECNGWDVTGLGDECREWRERDERREATTRAKVEDLASRLGFKVRFNGDPRGGAVRFILPSGRSNSWDTETWGIYW